MRELDVLSFVDRPWTYPSSKQIANSRQFVVNGVEFSLLLSNALDFETGAFTPLLDPSVNSELDEQFLAALLGSLPAENLRPGRVAVAFCSQCLDESCGEMVAIELRVDAQTVTWSHIGYEEEHFGEFVPLRKRIFSRVKSIDPPEWWSPAPEPSGLSFTFDRAAYELVIEAEIARVRASPSERATGFARLRLGRK